MTYSLQNSAENTTYSGNDIVISSTTGVISSKNLGIFSTTSLKITVTSTYSSLPCSGTIQSSAFKV
jgi:hypothetical protein